MVLAHWYDHTNILVQYDRYMSWGCPYKVSGSLTPDTTGCFSSGVCYAGRPGYANALKTFFIWWDGIDSWFISSSLGETTGPYWKRTATTIIGAYDPYGGSIGTATVAAGYF
jgi:hypothetical protein